MPRLPLLSRLLPLALLSSLAVGGTALAQEDDDADILAPAEAEEVKKPAVVKKKVGFVSLVPVGDANRPLADQVAEGLGKEFEEAEFEVVPLTLGSGAASGDLEHKAAHKALAKANGFLAKGRKYLKNLSFGRAEKAFSRAETDFAAAAPVLESMDSVIETHLGLAETYARQALDDKAAVALKNAARLDPERDLDPAKYPPQFIRSHKDIRGELLKGEKGAIFVDGTGRGGVVYVDGRKVGPAPLKVTQLPVGPHYVRVFAEGVGAFGEVVEVMEGEEHTVSPGWAKLDSTSPLDLLADNRFDDAAAKQVAGAAKAAGMAGAIVGVVSKGNTTVPTALIYVDAASGQVRHVDVLKFDGDLLNMSIEALKAREEIAKAMKKKRFSAVDDEPLIEGVASTGEVKVPEFGMRYQVNVQVAADTGTRRRAIGSRGDEADEGEGEGDEGGRRVLSGGKKRRQSLKDANRDPLAGPTRREVLTESDAPAGGSIWTNPWLWTSVAVGGAALLGVVGVGGGVGWYMTLPPSEARVNVILPE